MNNLSAAATYATPPGNITVASFVMFTIGVTVYNRYMSSWSFRSIFIWGQLFTFGYNIMDLLWVNRLNKAIGIPDEAMLLTEEVMGPIFDRMLSMPMYIIVASLLPEGTEATSFSLTMGLINFGTIIASYLGVGLLWLLGGVEAPTADDPMDEPGFRTFLRGISDCIEEY